MSKHYEVVSPTWTEYYSGYEPPEDNQCWVLVLAQNAKEAISRAIKHEDFKDWVEEARSDNVTPFKGVKATRTLCEHGVCWACAPDEMVEEGKSNCPLCQGLMDEEDARIQEAERVGAHSALNNAAGEETDSMPTDRDKEENPR